MVLLILAGILGCSKGKVRQGGYVPFQPCDCENPQTNFQDPRVEAYLFRDSILRQVNNPFGVWIVYNTETEEADILFAISGMVWTGPICNFPDFAKKWDIPQNGIKVYFEGRMYETCNPYGTTDAVRIDYVLTKLERR